MTDIPFCQILYDRRKKKPTFLYRGKGERKVNSLLERYERGERVNFLSLSFNLNSLPLFTRRVLSLVRKIPYGKVLSYGELAKRLGDKKKARAVGAALRKNPLPVIIPCHRVIKENGELGGYKGGWEIKKWLLEREGVLIKGRRVLEWKR
ncbi:MAG: MGMT family protein [candidate division WOR-3 bacterium]